MRREEIIDGRSGPMLMIENGKGGKSRAVPLPDEVRVMLADPTLPQTGWLFPRTDPPAGPIASGQVSKRCNAFLHDLGIAHSLHTLRHFYATTLYKATLNLRLVQQLMGHQSPVVTSQYTAVVGDDHAPVVRGLPEWWRGQLEPSEASR